MNTENKIKPILKWPGGKEKELKYIYEYMPKDYKRYFEPFVGGGSVFVSLPAEKLFINDKSKELIDLYKIIKSKKHNTDFVNTLKVIDKEWIKIDYFVEKNKKTLLENYKKNKEEELIIEDIVKTIYNKRPPLINGFKKITEIELGNYSVEIKKNISKKVKRMKAIESRKGELSDIDILLNITASMKSAFYMQFRYLYNMSDSIKDKVLRSVIFYFVRNYAYSGMFRYNREGKFNVPYGGIGYNRNTFENKINNLTKSELKKVMAKTKIYNEDFESFLNKNELSNNDFIFLDPPYDTDFSTYANNEFGKSEQERLAKYLIEDCKAKWLMIIKKTDYILDLYKSKKLKIHPFDKKYAVSFMNRNNKDVQHLIITNY